MEGRIGFFCPMLWNKVPFSAAFAEKKKKLAYWRERGINRLVDCRYTSHSWRWRLSAKPEMRSLSRSMQYWVMRLLSLFQLWLLSSWLPESWQLSICSFLGGHCRIPLGKLLSSRGMTNSDTNIWRFLNQKARSLPVSTHTLPITEKLCTLCTQPPVSFLKSSF